MERSREGIEKAQHEATKLLKRFGVECASHVNVEGFAARLGVALVDAPLQGATAQLVVTKGRARILLSTRISAEQRRYAVAHELGHFVLNHPAPPAEALSSSQYLRCSEHSDIEDEAHCFALRILSPTHGPWTDFEG
ncbi:MAG TPA: ImmA/IrrE family metallo-endopeptidase [Kofleriaceae bacterium]|nr:ImmA/IrrE family metallo-endopeptidase [Kofleriaceae bacterium]